MKIKQKTKFEKTIICFFLFCFFSSFKNQKFFLIKIRNVEFYKKSNSFIYNNLNFVFKNHKLYYNNNYNIVKISYQFQVFDSNHNSINPSDLTLYYNLHILCFFNDNNRVNVYSLASIEDDKFFKCIEFLKYHDDAKYGIIIYRTSRTGKIQKNYITYYIDKSFFNKKYIEKNFFDCSEINNKYNYILSQKQNTTERLKKLFVSKPICSLKRNFEKNVNKWHFVNLLDEYFCFCKGFECLKMKISNRCKYFFYLYLIDRNKNVYKKTDFLLMDFILKKYTSDDVYPIFEGMIKRKLNAHYLTEKTEIFKKYCSNKKFCNSIIYVKRSGYKINDDFLEKHLSLILKLRQVLTSVGVNINYINNLFYNIDYITYVCIGHGISYFKYYLYKSYYGPQNFDRLLIPNSEKLISMTLKYGWKAENLIKFNLPKWEKYNNINKSSTEIGNIKSESIFIMFTWREIKYNKKISFQYINNIKSLITNDELNNNLINNNLTLYFSLHHRMLKYKNKFKFGHNIKYLEEKNIAECLSKTNLVVTDFSSIIFDIIYRRKPYIIYIPDAYDPLIRNKYIERCYKVINNFKNNDFKFENIYFDLNSTIDKINNYIHNHFQLDSKLSTFYKEFNFSNDTSINDFINYILEL